MRAQKWGAPFRGTWGDGLGSDVGHPARPLMVMDMSEIWTESAASRESNADGSADEFGNSFVIFQETQPLVVIPWCADRVQHIRGSRRGYRSL